MASNKKYKCPFCKLHDIKEKLIYHIDKKHEDMIPEGFTAARILFHYIHKKPISEKGRCVICHNDTNWNEKTYKYNRLCDRRECKEKLRENYKKNMLRVFGTYNILNDMNQQEKMLKNRSISGIYKFRNGKIKDYVGSYEKKFLEFCDLMLGFDPDDIMMPGPTIEYEYKGQKHVWITDALIYSYNLICEIKDGGDHKNNREMTSYREKQIEKEKVITNKGEYNYLRLTDNQFPQLIAIIYELKLQMLDDPDTTKTISRVHESTEEEYYRVTYNGKGIYEELKKKVGFGWKELKDDPAFTWLPKPPEYKGNYRSYFTEKGYKEFKSKTLPITKKFLVSSNIKVQKTTDIKGKIVYQDKYQIVIKEDDSITESSQPLFISEKDIEYRVDDFRNHKVPVLWITGMSGGGKTTTANKIADEMNCDVLELDNVIAMFNKMYDKKDVSKYFVDKNYKIIYECIKDDDLSKVSDGELIVKSLPKILSRYSNRKQLIIEGVQVPWVFMLSKNLFNNSSIIIKGTSVTTSILNRFKRDKNNGEFINSITDIYPYIKMYYTWYKTQNKFRYGLEKNKMIKENNELDIIEVEVDNMKNNTKTSIQEETKIPEVNPKDIQFIKALDGTNNAYIVYKGDNYRVRVETLIVNDKGEVYIDKSDKYAKYGIQYRIPGGSVEPNRDFVTQAENECKEEVHINIKNAYYSGQNWVMLFPPNSNSSIPNFSYKGCISYIYVAEYNGKYHGYVKVADRDDMYKTGKFYKYKDIKWLPAHKKALEDYFKSHKVLKESGDTMNDVIRTGKDQEYYKYLKIHEVRLKASFNDRIYALKNALLLSKEQCEELKERILKHDASRYTPEEWDDWRKSYFPINDKEKEEGEESEKKARAHHYKVNAHHPEHWKGKEMDKVSIAEMIIDWEADSKADGGNPLKWWLYNDEAKEKKKLLNPKTREEVERVLQTIYDVDMNLKDNFDKIDDPKKAD